MSEKDLLLVVDAGTTNIKAALIDESGAMTNLTSREMPVIRDESGKTEHDPDMLFQLFTDICRQVCEGYRERIAALVISSYQFCILPVDKSMKPLAGIMTLLDTRPQETYASLLETFDVHEMYKRTGCPPLFQYPFSKIHWLKSAMPDVFAKTGYFLGSKDYLMLRLMGTPYTEASLATSTSLMNLETLEWDSYPLETLGIGKDQLPPVTDSMQNMGHLPAKTAELLGLPDDVYVIMGVYDGGAVGIGLGCMSEGTGIINLGTTAMLRVASDRPMVDANPFMRLQTCYLADRRWFPGGGINNAGIVLKWLRDNILGLSYDELINEARSVDDSAGLFCLPFLSGERNPQIGNLASGIFFGLRAYHKRGHMVRAALEGVAYMMRLISEALEENGVTLSQVKAGGGGSRSALWMQTIASVLQKPIVTSSVSEPALLGSAIIGFTSLGRYAGIGEATSVMTKFDAEYEPSLPDINRYNDGYDFYKYLVSHVGDMYSEHARRGL